MVSATDQNRRDLCDFSAFGNGLWPVTAELIEMAQYSPGHRPVYLSNSEQGTSPSTAIYIALRSRIPDAAQTAGTQGMGLL